MLTPVLITKLTPPSHGLVYRLQPVASFTSGSRSGIVERAGGTGPAAVGVKVGVG
jgi:hypothetical protein